MSDTQDIKTDGSPQVDEFMAQVDADTRLQPGEAGWWRVWGASARDIKGGDIVMTKSGDDYEAFYVESTYTAKAHPIRVGIVVGGQQQTFGALVGLVLYRKGTKNTLSDSI